MFLDICWTPPEKKLDAPQFFWHPPRKEKFLTKLTRKTHSSTLRFSSARFLNLPAVQTRLPQCVISLGVSYAACSHAGQGPTRRVMLVGAKQQSQCRRRQQRNRRPVALAAARPHQCAQVCAWSPATRPCATAEQGRWRRC